MLTNQNTTQENSKRCLKRNKRIYKFLTILTIIIILVSMLCINASAIVLQDITSVNGVYPSLIMYIPANNNNETLVEVSGIGNESLSMGNAFINTENGEISCQPEQQYYNNQYTSGFVYLGRYSSDTNFTNLYSNNKINMNLWEWSQKYEDNIIWQLWCYEEVTIEGTYKIEVPYFNNSMLMGTEPVEIDITRYIQPIMDFEGIYAYDIEIPKIDEIIEKTIEAIENESQAGITFQYKGEELRNNNYITNIYAEDGSKISIDFRKALSTILVNVRMEFNYISSDPGLNIIGIVNYNDYSVNDGITQTRTNDFRKLVIEDEFERSAEITMERQEKDVRILNWLGNAIAGIMNIEIFPNFSLGALLSVIVMIPLILWILKLVAGG